MVTNDNRDVIIEVTSRHRSVSDSTRDYATDKANKLLRFHNRISRIQIVMDRNKEDREIEMIVHVDNGRTFVARETAAGFKAALDPLLAKMERQLKKDNEKRKHHKGADGVRGPLPDDMPDDEETFDDAVRKDLGT